MTVWSAREKEKLAEELERLEAEHLEAVSIPHSDNMYSPPSMPTKASEKSSAGATSLTNLYVKQTAWLHRKETNASRLRREKDSNELEACTFKPKVNRSKSVHQSGASCDDVVERLMVAKDESTARLRQQKQMENKRAMKECTFQPTILEEEWTDYVVPRYLDPTLAKSPLRMDGDCTFTPRINKKAYGERSTSTQRYLDDHVFLRLATAPVPSPAPTARAPSKVLSAQDAKKFADRMQEFKNRQQRKVNRTIEEENAALQFTPRLAKKSTEIAKATTPFSQRLDRTHANNTSRGTTQSYEARDAAECTFTPRINEYSSVSAVPRSHTPDELCYHWNDRRAKRLAAAREEQQRHELESITFAPRTTSPPPHCNVSSRKSMISQPTLYMQRVTAEQVRQERLQQEHRRVMQSKEMAECTFKPSIHEAPQYVHSIAASMALARKSKGERDIHPKHTFGYS
jgi:hypothetical protein